MSLLARLSYGDRLYLQMRAINPGATLAQLCRVSRITPARAKELEGAA